MKQGSMTSLKGKNNNNNNNQKPQLKNGTKAELLDKDFKTTVLEMFKELKEDMEKVKSRT